MLPPPAAASWPCRSCLPPDGMVATPSETRPGPAVKRRVELGRPRRPRAGWSRSVHLRRPNRLETGRRSPLASRPCPSKCPQNKRSSWPSGNGLCFACFSRHEPHNGAHHGSSMLYRCWADSSRVSGSARLLRAVASVTRTRIVGMRLAAKPFLISLLVIVVLAVVGYLSFHAVGNLVSVNREIATRTVPAVRL